MTSHCASLNEKRDRGSAKSHSLKHFHDCKLRMTLKMSHSIYTAATLHGRKVLISGASSGLGAHIADLLDRCGAKIVVTARRGDSLKALPSVREGRAHAEIMDVTDPEAVDRVFDRVADRFGSLDAVVNNAGIAWGGRALEMRAEDWGRVIDTNLTGAFTVAQRAARLMADGQGGAILSTASILGLRAGNGVAAYAAAKAGLVHLTKVLALEWARHDIRVNAIAPGYIPTDINRDFLESEAGDALKRAIPLRRFGRPEDLDGAVILLLSDAGAYITGVTLPVDGGHLCSAL
ncbi:MAG: glucose 1-dehydrogenase [Pseudomonadota bacterium]